MSTFAGMEHAEEAAVPEHSFSANVTLATDYRFRGISQTFKEPTIQGGFDYAHSSGFYVGNWNSNVSDNSFTDGSIEMDLYGGYKIAVPKEFKADIGALHYCYHAHQISVGKTYNTPNILILSSKNCIT